MTKVLVVDDCLVDKELAGGFVKLAGCEVVFASDGKEALEIVASNKPEVVLTDLQMPTMDGLELVKRIRENHPQTPVILMTGHGSEEIAAEALRAGAASYVPKRNLSTELVEALQVVMTAVESIQQRDQVRESLRESTSHFELGYQPGGAQALISFLQDELSRVNFCDQSSLLRLATALTEAINNAMDHGNLELDSALREESGDAYRSLGNERTQQQPWCDRRVRITTRLTPSEVKFVIRDEGPGFSVADLPDPTDPENLLKASGRGIMLMNAFTDEVRFNDSGNEVTLVKRREESPK